MNSAAAVSSPSSSPFCPACGHNLTAEQPIELGPLQLDPRADARFGGRKIELTCAQFLLFSAIAQARGKTVGLEVLAERAGYDGEGDPRDVVHVLVSRIRHALRVAGCPPTIIRTVRGRGCAIDVELLLELAEEGPRKC